MIGDRQSPINKTKES